MIYYKGLELPNGNRYVFRTRGKAMKLFLGGGPRECYWGGAGIGTDKLAEKMLEPFNATKLARDFADEVLAMQPNKQ